MTSFALRWLSAGAAALALSAAHPAFAQGAAGHSGATPPQDTDRWAFSVGLDGRVSTGEFGRHVPDGGGGVRGIVDRRIGQSVLSVGGEMAWLLYDDETSPYSGEEYGRTYTSATTEHKSIYYGLLLRARRQTERWRPYADAAMGAHTFRTTTTVDGSGFDICVRYSCSRSGEISSTQLSDTTLTYGVGAGVARTITRERDLLLDLAVRYMWGGEAEYLTNGAIHRDGNTVVSIDRTRSRTDAVAVYIGLAWSRGL